MNWITPGWLVSGPPPHLLVKTIIYDSGQLLFREKFVYLLARSDHLAYSDPQIVITRAQCRRLSIIEARLIKQSCFVSRWKAYYSDSFSTKNHGIDIANDLNDTVERTAISVVICCDIFAVLCKQFLKDYKGFRGNH